MSVAIRPITLLLAALGVFVLGGAGSAHAESESAPGAQAQPEPPLRDQLKDVWDRDTLTGNWGGMRTQLHDHGVDVGLRLSQYGQWVASGGVEENGEYGGRMDYRVNADLRKLFGLWEGLSFNLHAMTRFGQDVSADSGSFVLENAGLLMPLPGDYSGTNVTGLTITQSLFDERADVFFGKLDVIDLVTGFFPQLGYGQEGFYNVNALVSALPWFGSVRGLSLWGGGAWTVKNEMVQGGFIFAGTENVTTTFDFGPSFEDGVFMAGFYRFFWELSDMPGYFLVFGGGSTADQASNDPHDIVYIPGAGLDDDRDRKNPWDIAAYVYQVFWHAEDNPNRKATVFVGGTGGPDNPQFAQWNVFAAVEGFGVTKRAQDRMGVAGWYNPLSKNFIDDSARVGISLHDTWGVEVYYNFEINKWLHLTPDLQIAQNEREIDDVAIIPGIRLVMDF